MTVTQTARETAFELLCRRIAEHTGSYPRGHGRQANALCPVHDDRMPSLSITDGNDRVLIKCQAGCDTDDILTALALTRADLFNEPHQKREKPAVIAAYEYTDEHGQVLFVKERRVPKDFRVKRPDGRGGWIWSIGETRRVLYRLPQILEAIRDGHPIYLVEGEKDVHAAERAGAVATCNFDGAAKQGHRPKWRPEYGDLLKGAHVTIVADNDTAGLAHARTAYADLRGKAASVRIVRGLVDTDHADLSDHLAAGHSLDQLAPLDTAPPAAEDTVATDEAPGRALVLTPASEIRIRPVRWLWDTTPDGETPTAHGRIPMNSLTLAAGGPGLGKSQFAAWLTARITRGELPGELHGKPRGVIYAATEDSWAYTIAPRLIAAGADMELVFRIDVRDDGEMHARLTLPLDTALIGQAAETYSIALLIADPLLSLIDKTINDYRAAEVRQALEPLVAAADKHHFTILGLAHFTKAGTADPLARVAGSGAFGQLIRSLIAFAKQEDENGDPTFLMSLEKNNLGRLGLPSHQYTIQPYTVRTDEGPSYVSRFVLGAETNDSVRDAMREDNLPDGTRAEANETLIWLRAHLEDAGGSDDAKDIKKAARSEGFSNSALHRAKDKLGIQIQRTGFGKDLRSYWTLPGTAPEEDTE